MAISSWTSARDFKCFRALACAKNLCVNKLDTHPVSDWQTDLVRPLNGSRNICWSLLYLLVSVITAIFRSTYWSYLVHVMLGVAQWQAKGNQIQMDPGLGPLVKAAVGPCRSWLLSGGCTGRKQCEAGYTGVVPTATLETGRGEGSRHKLITFNERFTGHGRGQMCVTNSKGICF